MVILLCLLTDLYALLHDTHYALTTSKEESIVGDNNYFNEPSDNIDFAVSLIGVGDFFNITPGPSYGSVWSKPHQLKIYETILNALWKGFILDWGYLVEKYYDFHTKRFILTR